MITLGNTGRIFIALLMISSLFCCGCDAGSNEPVATALSTGSGYKIQLASSVGSIKVGGTSTLTAVVFEPDGSPIRDNEEVFFASSEKGSLSETSVKTVGGMAIITYTAGTNALKFDRISATCRGATAILQIEIVPENF